MKHLLLFLFLLPVTLLFAQWSNDPTVNNPICVAPDAQVVNKIISDNNGGAIVTWQDSRNGVYQGDIYAQRIDLNGIIQWSLNGTVICDAANSQFAPQITSDGSGGAIITWRNYDDDIYAQRVNQNGVIQWDTNGIIVCSSTTAFGQKIISDGNGGAIITWQDFRNAGTSMEDIYVQKINSNGITQWQNNGVAICTDESHQKEPIIISNGNGGAIIAWNDSRNFFSSLDDLYAQMIDSAGIIQWTLDGVPICTAADEQYEPQITTDGNGGAMITWSDLRNAGTSIIYAQRINPSGAVQWTLDGIPICISVNSQSEPQITSDENGGAIIAWVDYDGSDLDIYAQRINSSGVIQWAADGAAICTAPGFQWYIQIIGDGSSGAIITWEDLRNTDGDVYAQKINSSGLAQWTTNGVSICSATGGQGEPQITSDESGGALITWYDMRSTTDSDIYASQVGFDGVLGHIIPVELVSFSSSVYEDKVVLNWSTATETNNSGFNIERSNENEFQVLGFAAGHGTTTEIQNYTFTDANVSNGKYSYRLKQIDLDGTFEYSKTIEVEVTTPLEFSLAQNYPNPFNPSTTIKYNILSEGTGLALSAVTLKVYDVLGREVATLVNEEKPAGTYEVNFNAAGFSSGVYFYTLKAGSFTLTKSLVLVK